jgi:hypothetical protein
MKIFLLGAGASFGSDVVGTPPMGGTLFDALRAFNPAGWGQLPTDLASLFRSDFERGMAQLAEVNPHAMPILQRAMAAFFFEFKPRPLNLYVELGKRMRLRGWSGAVGTLNYERLLEMSLGHAGVQPVVAQSAGAGQVELCLPHGCCHLFCDGARMSSAAVSFSGAAVTIDGPVTVVDDPRQFAARIDGDAVPPVMSYFEPKKATTAGASFIRSQRARWAELVSLADVVAIVGVRVRPDDDHIWKPIAECSARLVYCAGASAVREFQAWARSTRGRVDHAALAGYFADQFESIWQQVGLG